MKRNRRILLEVLDISMFISGLVIIQLFGLGHSVIEMMVTLLGIALIRGASCIDKRPYNELDEIKINPKAVNYIAKNIKLKDKYDKLSDRTLVNKAIEKLLKLERNYYKIENKQENKDCYNRL